MDKAFYTQYLIFWGGDLINRRISQKIAPPPRKIQLYGSSPSLRNTYSYLTRVQGFHEAYSQGLLYSWYLHWAPKCHRCEKSTVNLDSNSGPLAFSASVLPTELFRLDLLTDSHTPVYPAT